MLQNTHLFCNRVHIGRSTSSKINNFGINRKRVCNFLLVRHRDYGPTLHRFWDTATYWLKIAYFCYPSLIRRPLPKFAVEVRGEIDHGETQGIGLHCGESSMILSSTVFDWSTRVTDRWTRWAGASNDSEVDDHGIFGDLGGFRNVRDKASNGDFLPLVGL